MTMLFQQNHCCEPVRQAAKYSCVCHVFPLASIYRIGLRFSSTGPSMDRHPLNRHLRRTHLRTTERASHERELVSISRAGRNIFRSVRCFRPGKTTRCHKINEVLRSCWRTLPQDRAILAKHSFKIYIGLVRWKV